jgi:uncharacterized protein (DUF2267 family)
MAMSIASNRDRKLAERATATVFHTLRDRLTPGEADQLAAQLPRELRQVWDQGAHEGRVPTKLHLPEFLERVKDGAGLPSAKEARWMTLAVFAALKEHVSTGESADVWSQLPKDLKELWAEARAA